MIRTKYLLNFRCRYCGAEYEQFEVRAVEDFEQDEPLPPLPPPGP
jgi:hypothetical protein